MTGTWGSIEERFHRQYIPEPNTGCWLWAGPVSRLGYGSIRTKAPGSMERAHRLSYKLYHGDIGLGLFVCHRCDVRCCVNPDHLFLGTRQENMDDMVRKGRGNSPRGEGTNTAKLIADDALRIYAMRGTGVTATQLARKYGVSRHTINNIWRRRTWLSVLPSDGHERGRKW